MKIKELIDAISEKHKNGGIEIYSPASAVEIQTFENQIGFQLPDDFKELYSCCNGFACTEDIFNLIPLNQIRIYPDDYGATWFYFSEYMIYSDTWGLRITSKKQYEIFNGTHPDIVLTSSLKDFLERFLRGNVFDSGGLDDWQKEAEVR